MDQVGRRRAVSPLRTAWFWRWFAIRAGAVIGVLCLVAIAASAVSGATPIAFRTSSMEPAISAGDLAFAHTVAASDVEAGDVVSVLDRSGRRVTHRVERVDPFGGSIRLTLKADALPAPDAQTYDVADVDRVGLVLPLLGYLVGPAGGLPALLLGSASVACLALVLVTTRRGPGGARRSSTRRVPDRGGV